MIKNKNIKKSIKVTQEYLDRHFDKIDKRFKKMDKRFGEMLKYVDSRFEKLFVYLDHRFEPLEKMAEDYPRFKSLVYDKLDWLVGMYQKFDDEYYAISGQHFELIDKVDNHEKRITKLENKNN